MKRILFIGLLFIASIGTTQLSAQPEGFYGEIRMFAGNFAPVNWAFCNGQTLQIQGNEALFSLLGTTYGGDARTTFMLPNLMGRTPVGTGQRGEEDKIELGGVYQLQSSQTKTTLEGLGMNYIICTSGWYPSRQ